MLSNISPEVLARTALWKEKSAADLKSKTTMKVVFVVSVIFAVIALPLACALPLTLIPLGFTASFVIPVSILGPGAFFIGGVVGAMISADNVFSKNLSNSAQAHKYCTLFNDRRDSMEMVFNRRLDWDIFERNGILTQEEVETFQTYKNKYFELLRQNSIVIRKEAIYAALDELEKKFNNFRHKLILPNFS